MTTREQKAENAETYREETSWEETADGQKNGEPGKAKNARGKSCNGAEPLMDRTEKLQRLSFETGEKRA